MVGEWESEKERKKEEMMIFLMIVIDDFDDDFDGELMVVGLWVCGGIEGVEGGRRRE